MKDPKNWNEILVPFLLVMILMACAFIAFEWWSIHGDLERICAALVPAGG